MKPNSEISNIKTLIMRHKQRLQLLKIQEATYGISVDPRIPIEINDIEKAIQRLEIQLENLIKFDIRNSVDNPLQHDFSTLSLVHEVWNIFDADLQDALSLAYNQSVREGKNRISTQRFFSAIVRLQPDPLSELLNAIPKDALPQPVSSHLSKEKIILSANPQLSSCVEGSLEMLTSRIPSQQELRSTDLFLDVAKYGTGSSVRQLRTYGVTPETLDKILNQLGWSIFSR